jgi:dienelactone hydrolase
MTPYRTAFAGFNLAVLAAPLSAIHAQDVGPPLVVPTPAPAQVSVHSDSFVPTTGPRRGLRVYRPIGSQGRLPVVVFANGTNADFNTWRGYVGWARLVTSRGMAGVLYQGPTFDTQRSFAENIQTSIADLDSVVAVLRRRGEALGVDASNLVVWAGSGQTSTGTPFALTGSRTGVRGYVLYYGGGSAPEPRVDVPVLLVRAGLDSPELNRGLDSLAQRLTLAGAAVTLVTHPSGPHAFDVSDSSDATARVIAATLDFMAAAIDRKYQAAIAAGAPAARASAAFASGRWDEAERLYAELFRSNPANRVVAWRLGLAELAAGHPAEALVSFDRAKALGQGGARDIGLPAARAAVRAGKTDRAVEWIKWALTSFPRIRAEIAADRELGALLEHPELRSGT